MTAKPSIPRLRRLTLRHPSPPAQEVFAAHDFVRAAGAAHVALGAVFAPRWGDLVMTWRLYWPARERCAKSVHGAAADRASG